MCGKTEAVDANDCSNWLENLSDLILNYDTDEIRLYHKCFPRTTIIYKGEKCSRGKNSKEKLTILSVANMTGTDKN